MVPSVSIIIPIYNAGQYLEKCTVSLFSQTLNNIEYIFVNDGSTDDSITVLNSVINKYPLRKHQITIVNHEKNEGICKARQHGVEAASGDYVIHCDPDDWVEMDYYETIYSHAASTNADIVVCDYYQHSSNTVRKIHQCPASITSSGVIRGICGIERPILHGSLCNKLIRRQCYDKIIFPQNITYCEDTCIIFQILSRANKIEYIEKAFYHYVEHPNSLSRVSRKDNFNDDLELIRMLRDILSNSKINDWEINWLTYAVSIIINRIFIVGLLSDREFRSLVYPYVKGIKSNKRYSYIKRCVFKFASRYNYPLGLMLWKLSNKLKI